MKPHTKHLLSAISMIGVACVAIGLPQSKPAEVPLIHLQPVLCYSACPGGDFGDPFATR